MFSLTHCLWSEEDYKLKFLYLLCKLILSLCKAFIFALRARPGLVVALIYDAVLTAGIILHLKNRIKPLLPCQFTADFLRIF